MSIEKKTFWKRFSFGLGAVALIVVVGFGMAHVAHALTIENVGSTLGLGSADLKQTIINVIKWVLGLLGLVATIIVIYGGFLWMTARGNQQQIDKAKRTLLNGIIGLVIILVAWALVLFIQRFITNATQSGAQSGQCVVNDSSQWPTCTICDDNGDGIPGNNQGTLIPDPSPTCNGTGSKNYYATWEDPAIKATDVKLCAAVSGAFGGLPAGRNDIDPSSTFAVARCSGGGCSSSTPVTGTLSFNNNVATFLHTGTDFAANSTYTVDVTGVKSAPDGINASLPIPPDGWTFGTGTTSDQNPPTVLQTAPAQGSQLACLSPVIQVRFSETMLPPSIFNKSNLTLVASDGGSVPGISRIDMPSPNVMQVTLDAPLRKLTTYTVTLSANNGADTTKGYRDTCANALDCGNAPFGTCTSSGLPTAGDPGDNFKWQFSTKDTDTQDCTPTIDTVDTVAYHGDPGNRQLMTITGTNFGFSSVVNFTGNIVASQNAGGGSLCFANNDLPNQTGSPACISTNTDTQIQTIVPPGPLTYTPTGAASGPVSVTLGGKTSPPSATSVQIGSPHINWISPNSGKAGRYVTISGTGFGNGGIVTFRNSDGTKSAVAVSPSCNAKPWTSAQILIQVPSSPSFNPGDVAYVQVDSNNFNDVRGMSNLARFDFKDVDGPNLCSINPTSSNDGAAGLTAFGSGFGTVPSDVSIYYSNFTGTTPTGLTDTQLTTQPSGRLANGLYRFTVGVKGTLSNPLDYQIPKDKAPEVVVDASCNIQNGVFPSPNPTLGATDVCRNARVTLRFSEDMQVGTITDPTKVFLQQCGSGPTFVSGTCSTNVSISYSVAGRKLLLGPTGPLTSDTWYQGTVKSSVLSTAGAPMTQDFTWHFRVRSGNQDCIADAVGVDTSNPGPKSTGQTQNYTAAQYTSTCQELLNATGNYSWVLSNPLLASLAQSGTFNENLAATVLPGTTDETADVKATLGTLSGKSTLQVIRNYCEKATDCSTQRNGSGTLCTGSDCDLATHRCTPYVDNLQSNTGPAGDIVNVNGCFFGNSKGTGNVRFTSGGTTAYGSFALCGPAGWTNDTIKVQAAPNNATPGTVWNVDVITDAGLQSNAQTYTIANQCPTPTNGTTPDLPNGGKPILCNINKTSVKEGDSLTYSGDKFATTGGQALFTAPTRPANWFPLLGTGTSMTPNLATTTVPIGPGMPSDGSSAQTTVSAQTPSGATCLATPANLAISCTQNRECGSGCCSSFICQSTATCTAGLIGTYQPFPAGALQCRNTDFTITFLKPMQAGTITTSTIRLLSGGTPVAASVSLNGQVATLHPQQPLGDGTYTLTISGGSGGVQATDGTFLAGDFSIPPYTVSSSATICQIVSVEIHDVFNNTKITSDQFTCSGDTCAGDRAAVAGNQHHYIAQAYDRNGNGPLGLSAWNWKEGTSGGSPSGSNTYGVCTGGAPCTGQSNQADYWDTALNSASGSESLTVDVTGTGTSGTGSTSIPITTFLCANPWPTNGAPFVDPALVEPSHDFQFQICQDQNPQYTLSNYIIGQPAGNLVKEYFFFVQDTKNSNANTGDAIGVRLINNPQDFSPVRWYQYTFGKDPSGSAIDVDGYPALREGRTVYVAADDMRGGGNSSPYIYVFSYTDKASSATVAMFDTMLQHLRFNRSTTEPLASNLRSDLKRVHAYEEIIYSMQAYSDAHKGAYPSLASGTYLTNYTMTPWPSWQQTFGAALGSNPPRDPVTQWNTTWPGSPCTGANVDSNTCWDDVGKHMFFPNNAADPPYSNGIAVKMFTTGTNTSGAMIYGTASNHFWSHISLFTQKYGNTLNPNACDGQNFGTITRNVNICPAGSQCLGFNLQLCSEFFSTTASLRTKRDTKAPNPVSLVSPATGATLSGQVEIVASAVDEVGGSGVGVLNFTVKSASGTQQVTGTASTTGTDGNYHWTFNTRQFVNASGYVLTFTATDKAGNTSNAVTATYTIQNAPGDPTPPVITLLSPNTNTTLTGTVNLSASATDNQANDTGIDKVQFYFGTSLLGTSTCSSNCSSPFTATATNVDTTTFPVGDYTYSVVAYDKFGNTSIKQLTVRISRTSGSTPAPSIAIVFPTGTVTGASSNVVADVTDNSGKGIDYVTFRVDSETNPRATITGAPFTFTWQLVDAGGTPYGSGTTHTILATAFDRAGNKTGTTATLTFVTGTGPDTQRPVISNVSPADGATIANTTPIQALVTDNATVQRVDLYIDNVQILLTGTQLTCSTPGSCQLNYPWDTLPESVGTHSIAISAFDDSNNASTVSFSVSVVNKVFMSFTAPAQGANVTDGYCSDTGKSCKSNADCGTTSKCTNATSVQCDGDFDCINIKSCSSYKNLCSTNAQCQPGETCITSNGKCIQYTGGTCTAATKIVLNISKTCRTDQLLSNVKLYVDSTTNPAFATITNCTATGQCTYNWSSKTTVSNGAHTIIAIGTDSSGCTGGAKVNVIVKNQVTDTTPPMFNEFSYVGDTWGGGTPVYTNKKGNITVRATDPPGGSGLNTIGITITDGTGATIATQNCSMSPCQLNWNPADGGNYRVTATATDISGNSATPLTQVVNVDTTPPTASWLSPADGSTVNSPPDVTLSASASDPTNNGYASGIQSILFSENGAQWYDLPMQSGSTWSLTEPLNAGTNAYNVEVTDRAGNTFTTPDITLIVQGLDTRAPWVLIESPVDGYISGTFTPIARGGDWNGTGIRDVQFYLDGAPLGSPVLPPSPFSSSASVNTTTMTQGSAHTLYAVACDKATPTNNCTTSSTVTFLVNNNGGNNCGPLICSGATPDCCGGPPYVCQSPNSACSYGGGSF